MEGQDWNQVWERRTTEQYVEAARRPSVWQIELARHVRQQAGPAGSTLEVGCGTGVVSVLLGSAHRRVLLDKNDAALTAAKAVFESMSQAAEFIEADMFDMPVPNDSTDVVFNSGVLEHFERTQRILALRECLRVARPGGWVTIAVPNHGSLPYRLAYKGLTRRGRWPYPEELDLTGFEREMSAVGLETIERRTVDRDTAYRFAARFSPVLARGLRSVLGEHVEGYLAIYSGRVPSGSVSASRGAGN